MLLSKIKLDQSKSSNSLSKPKLGRDQSNVSNKMHFVRDKMDNHLAKTYQKLKINNEKPLLLNKSTKIIDESNRLRQPIKSDIIQIIDLKRRKNFSTNSQYYTPIPKQSQTIPTKKQIVLISNQDVMQYIKLVYETYNIKDPLQRQENDQDDETTQATISKNKFGFEEIQSISSARTTKAFADIVEVSQFNIEKEQTIRNTTKRNNKILITLRSKTASKKDLQRSGSKMNPLFKNREESIKKTINIKKNEPSKHQDESFPSFRYCFACQQPILENNILKHEETCLELQRAFTFSYRKIIELLNEKIERIKATISRELVETSVKQLSHRFQNMQSSIKSWIKLISSHNSQKQAFSTAKSPEAPNWRRQYQKVKQQINQNFSQKFELLNKLNWFARLHQNISNHNKFK